jgi:hypothetical protein
MEAHLGIVVADLLDRVADNLRDIDSGLRGDLPGHHDQVRLHQRLAGNAALRVLGQHGVEDRIGDAIGDLVRVAHRHRFAGEQIVPHVTVGITHIQSFRHILSTLYPLPVERTEIEEVTLYWPRLSRGASRPVHHISNGNASP